MAWWREFSIALAAAIAWWRDFPTSCCYGYGDGAMVAVARVQHCTSCCDGGDRASSAWHELPAWRRWRDFSMVGAAATAAVAQNCTNCCYGVQRGAS